MIEADDWLLADQVMYQSWVSCAVISCCFKQSPASWALAGDCKIPTLRSQQGEGWHLEFNCLSVCSVDTSQLNTWKHNQCTFTPVRVTFPEIFQLRLFRQWVSVNKYVLFWFIWSNRNQWAWDRGDGPAHCCFCSIYYTCWQYQKFPLAHKHAKLVASVDLRSVIIVFLACLLCIFKQIDQIF